MPSVNIRIEVSDEINERVIKPLKAQHKLKDLIRTTFEQYHYNDEFKYFIEQGYRDLDEDDITSLVESINNLTGFIENSEYIANELHSNINSNLADIEDGIQIDTSDELDLDGLLESETVNGAAEAVGTASNEELSNLASKVDALTDSVQTMQSMFQAFMSGAMVRVTDPVRVAEPAPVAVAEPEPVAVAEPVVVVEETTKVAPATKGTAEDIQAVEPNFSVADLDYTEEDEEEFEDDFEDDPVDPLEKLMGGSFVGF